MTATTAIGYEKNLPATDPEAQALVHSVVASFGADVVTADVAEAWTAVYWSMADMLIEQLALPQGYQIAFGMALGYEDTAAPINQWRSGRAQVEDWCEMRGFD